MSSANILKNLAGIECAGIDEILMSHEYPLGVLFSDKNEIRYAVFKDRSIDEVFKIKSDYSNNAISILCENSGEIYYDISDHGILMPLFGRSPAVKLSQDGEWLISAGTVDGTFLYTTNYGIFRAKDSRKIAGKDEIQKTSVYPSFEIIEGEKSAYCISIKKDFSSVAVMPIHYENEMLSLDKEIFSNTCRKKGGRLVSSAVVLDSKDNKSRIDTIACLTDGQLILNGTEIKNGEFANCGFGSLSYVNSIALLHKDNETADILINALHYFARVGISLKDAKIVSTERIGINGDCDVHAAVPVKNREMHEKILALRQ